MKKRFKFKAFSLFLCIVLIAVTALIAVGCQEKTEKNVGTDVSQGKESNNDETDVSKVLGTGAVNFYFTVTDKNGNAETYAIKTDKKIVGDALQELGLISGDEGEYGLYVKTVNGIEADFDKDGTYWAFYINGEYAMSGVDSTKIEPGATYTLKVEK